MMLRRNKNKQNHQRESHPNPEERSTIGPSFFYEDEIFKINKNGDVEFGMVTENWDMYSSDEDEEDDDDFDRSDRVAHGCVAVTWLPKSKDEVLPEKKVYTDC
jgi:ubiquitin-conjugating enzyme E2 O